MSGELTYEVDYRVTAESGSVRDMSYLAWVRVLHRR